MRNAWFTPTIRVTSIAGIHKANDNRRSWTSMPQLMKLSGAVIQTQIREASRTNSRHPNPNFGNRPSAFDRIGLGSPTSRPFGGIGLDDSQITQERRRSRSRSHSPLGEINDLIPLRGGGFITAVRMIENPPRKGNVTGVEGLIGSTKRLEAGR
ncbi:hypothetical protein PIB30_099426 [Stylosanthes scabra]|uniref:Uncharacterized protein n=1 Tax=Stylosanthes scabra TaxID=79078 RepID=A0ABU6VYR4_9FABA|nr:hypothetical protein [Stylosanthes scabra]